MKLNAIEEYTNEIIHSALEIIEIDRFVSNLMDDSLHQVQTTTTTNSSPLSPVIDEILLTDSSPSSIRNNNAYDSKILSSIGSYFINNPKPIVFTDKRDPTIRFAQCDASSDAQLVSYHEKLSLLSNTHYQELLRFLSNQIANQQWSLNEYIGCKGQRAWRAMKLAADISNLDSNLTLNYHQIFDWLPLDNNLGSFNQRTYLIVRDFARRLERIHADI